MRPASLHEMMKCTLSPSLLCNSLYRPDWPRTQRSLSFAGIKSVCCHCLAFLLFNRITPMYLLTVSNMLKMYFIHNYPQVHTLLFPVPPTCPHSPAPATHLFESNHCSLQSYWLSPVQVIAALWGREFHGLSCPEDNTAHNILLLLYSFCPIFCGFPEPWWGGGLIQMPPFGLILNKHYLVSAHWPVGSVCWPAEGFSSQGWGQY